MIYILFGLPGAGKTYVGKLFEKHFNFHFYEGDTDMSGDMHAAVRQKVPFTDEMRDNFFHTLLKSTKELAEKHDNLVVTQTFIKEKYRKLFLKAFPTAQFILVIANDKVRENRLTKRKDYPLDLEYTRRMIKNFDFPAIPHLVIDNSVNGEALVKKQIKSILEKKVTEQTSP